MRLPKHLAIIMDGNGRWAEARGYDRTFGHLRGAKVAKNVIELCGNLGISHLTLYAFSTENWMRPKHEVGFLMNLLARHMRKERQTLLDNNVKMRTIGDLTRLPEAVANEVRKTCEATQNNTGMVLTFAISYGSRQELTCAMRAIAQDVAAGRLSPEAVTEELIQSHLQTSQLPDPDLIVRTSGEFRLSNFMMWQAAYSEIFVTEKLWPDFDEPELRRALDFFATRERRFGKTQQQIAATSASDKVADPSNTEDRPSFAATTAASVAASVASASSSASIGLNSLLNPARL